MQYAVQVSTGRYPVGVAVSLLFCLLLTPRVDGVKLRGKILEDHSGEPVTSARIKVLQAGNTTLAADLDSGRDGQFQSPELSQGRYRLEISKSNYAGVVVSVQVSEEGGAAKSIVVRLVRFGVIGGRVLDAQNMPIERAWVFPMVASARGGLLRPLRPVLTGREGRYRLHGLAPGRYALAATLAAFRSGVGVGAMFYPDNSQPKMFSISGGEDYRNVDFSFFESSQILVSGSVNPAAPGKSYAISLVPKDSPILSTALTQTETDGKFSLDGIPPGAYYLLASGPVRGHRAREAILEDRPSFGRAQIEVGGQNLDGVTLEIAERREAGFVLGVENGAPPPGCPIVASLLLTPLENWGSSIVRQFDVGFTNPQFVENLAPGRYSLTARNLNEYCFSETRILDLTEPAEREIIAAPVIAAGEILGHITGMEEDLGYSVVLVSSDSYDETQTLRVAYPDMEGSFSFSGLRPGRYRITATDVSTTEDHRWIPDLTEMFELDVMGGAPTHLELPIRRNER